TATGTIFLINPNGIIFGQDAVVNVGSLVASSLTPDDAAGFMDEDGGGYLNDRFTWSAGASPGEVINQGRIQSSGGHVVLLGGAAGNAAGGTIDVGDGIAALLAGGEAQVELVAGGAPVVRVTGAAPAVPASGVAVENAGNIILSHAGNDFVGTVDLRGDAVEIADAGTLALGTIGVNRLYARAATIDLASDVSTSGDQEYHGALELGA